MKKTVAVVGSSSFTPVPVLEWSTGSFVSVVELLEKVTEAQALHARSPVSDTTNSLVNVALVEKVAVPETKDNERVSMFTSPPEEPTNWEKLVVTDKKLGSLFTFDHVLNFLWAPGNPDVPLAHMSALLGDNTKVTIQQACCIFMVCYAVELRPAVRLLGYRLAFKLAARFGYAKFLEFSQLVKATCGSVVAEPHEAVVETEVLTASKLLNTCKSLKGRVSASHFLASPVHDRLTLVYSVFCG